MCKNALKDGTSQCLKIVKKVSFFKTFTILIFWKIWCEYSSVILNILWNFEECVKML